MKHFSILLLAGILGLTLVSCSRKTAPTVPPAATIAVAGFTQPTSPYEMLAGYPAAEDYEAAPDEIKTLNTSLVDVLLEHDVNFIRPGTTRQCEEITLADLDGDRIPALEYWTRVGRCVPAEFILVPHILYWQEREGGDWGSRIPASVTMDLYLIELSSGKLKQRFHFDERQKSLSENILEAPKFFIRGGKWISAEELARDGIEQGLKELGL